MIVAVIILIIHGGRENLCPSLLSWGGIQEWNSGVLLLCPRLETVEAPAPPKDQGKVWGIEVAIEAGKRGWDLSGGGAVESPLQRLPGRETEAVA